MKIRCDLHLNGGARKLVLVPAVNESVEHLALKLAAYLLFWSEEPFAEISAKHPAMARFDFFPDLVAFDESGDIKLWVECGSTTMNKMSKLTRRLPQGRIVVLKETPRDARRLREDLKAQLERESRVDIWAWPGTTFRDWAVCLAEKTEVYGEAGGLSFNLVINERPIIAELQRF